MTQSRQSHADTHCANACSTGAKHLQALLNETSTMLPGPWSVCHTMPSKCLEVSSVCVSLCRVPGRLQVCDFRRFNDARIKVNLPKACNSPIWTQNWQISVQWVWGPYSEFETINVNRQHDICMTASSHALTGKCWNHVTVAPYRYIYNIL